MIHIFLNQNNIQPDDFQKVYDDTVCHLEIHRITCPHCHKSGLLIMYGSYVRYLRLLSKPVKLTIQRLFCNNCRKTHALLPECVVPYSQIPLDDQRDAILGIDILTRNNLIEESEVRNIKRKFRKVWKERLISAGISLDCDLTIECFRVFSMQFMQIRAGCCGLFCKPT